MWNSFFAASNLLGKDQAAYVPDFLKSPEKYCSWETVEDALHRSDMYWELIMPDGSKRDIEVYKPAWARTPDQDKKHIHNHIMSGLSFVILSYSRANARVRSLCAEIERHFDVNTDIHVYGARDSANSFVCWPTYVSIIWLLVGNLADKNRNPLAFAVIWASQLLNIHPESSKKAFQS